MLAAWLCATLALVLAGAGAPRAFAADAFRVQRLCGASLPGDAQCMAMKLVPASLTRAQLRASAIGQAAEAAAGATPAVNVKNPYAGYLTPAGLHAAYSLPTATVSSSLQTIALIDAYDDPTAESDLAVYDKEFGLPECTAADGCFRKVDQEGKATPLPAKEGEWAGEISIDVQMAHAVCQNCRILLVEANSESFADLGAAVNTAVALGATEISNSYAGPELKSYTSYRADYDHPGVAVTVASGDCGYINQACSELAEAANFPADSPDVVAVGGTALTEDDETEAWSSSAWEDGGSGCSAVFAAPLWQTSLAGFVATGCGSGRSIADVAAIGDPETGVNVYDSTPEGNGDPTGWGVWGGTSVASPILAAEFALDGGAHGVSYPASTLYTHLGDAEDVYDVVSGSNGVCAGASACNAGRGYDGPTGVGSPVGLGAFVLAGTPSAGSRPTVSGTAEQGFTLTATPATWSPAASSTGLQWEQCNAAGSGCQAIAGATGSTYKIAAADVGGTLRLQETASDAAGEGAPTDSAQTAVIASDVPTVTSFAPSSGITGATVVVQGAGLAAATRVEFGALAASFKVVSSTELEAVVPNGASNAKLSVTTAGAAATSKRKFKVTLTITAVRPLEAAPGSTVTIKGVGFNSSSTVSFDGTPASVTRVSAKKLTVVVPAGAGAGPISVHNASAPLGTVLSAVSFNPA